MTRNRAFSLNHWSFKPSDRILPDANFWVNVFGPAAVVGQRNHRGGDYSNALRAMLQKKVALFLDVLVLSEFVNVLARMEFNSKFKGKYGPSGFKRFRNSPDFIPIARTISGESRKILKLCQRIDHSFAKWDFNQILADFEEGGEDINDQLIIEVSRDNNFIILTDDGDMTQGGLNILTANPKLLTACPN